MTVCTEAEALAALRTMARLRGGGGGRVFKAVIVPRSLKRAGCDAGYVLTGAVPFWWIRETGELSSSPRVPSRPDDVLSCVGPAL